MPEKPSDGIAVPLVWVGLEEAEIKFVNQIIVQMGPPGHEGEFVISLGQLQSPVLIGDEKQVKQALRSLPYVPVKTVTKAGVPVERVREFIDVLQRVVKNYEQQKSNRRTKTRRP